MGLGAMVAGPKIRVRLNADYLAAVKAMGVRKVKKLAKKVGVIEWAAVTGVCETRVRVRFGRNDVLAMYVTAFEGASVDDCHALNNSFPTEGTAFDRMFRAEALVNLTEDTEVRHARIEALLNPVLGGANG